MKITVNGKHEFLIDQQKLNGDPVEWDLIETSHNGYHIIKNNRGYNVTVKQYNPETKTAVLSVNGNDYEVSIRDKNDLLLEKLGINAKSSAAINDIKAPMPGMIIQVSAAEGVEIKKGDVILILEAMKMENVIKSPRDGKIKKVHIELKQTVEKNQLLVEFEK